MHLKRFGLFAIAYIIAILTILYYSVGLGRNEEEGRDHFEISLFPIFGERGKGSKILPYSILTHHSGNQREEHIRKVSYIIKILFRNIS